MFAYKDFYKLSEIHPFPYKASVLFSKYEKKKKKKLLLTRLNTMSLASSVLGGAFRAYHKHLIREIKQARYY